MLPKELRAIKAHLSQLTVGKIALTKEQARLLHELDFIDNSAAMAKDFNSYTYQVTVLESFAAAGSNCPSCGKKY